MTLAVIKKAMLASWVLVDYENNRVWLRCVNSEPYSLYDTGEYLSVTMAEWEGWA